MSTITRPTFTDNDTLTAAQFNAVAVSAVAVADGEVTLAKMANLATNKLIGRSTAGTGVPEAIDCTAAGRALLDDADAAAQRTTLGLGTLATSSATLGALATLSTAPVANGGTGQTTAELARVAINQGQTTLTDAVTIATDCAVGNCFAVTLGGNRTLGAPSNLVAGATYLWKITQDGTGSRTLSYASCFKFPAGTAPTLSTDAGAVDILTGYTDGTHVYASLANGFA